MSALLQEGPDSTRGMIKLAILAVGGQGGGVLTNWITDLAMRCGWYVQATSVAGVAQRTGATIYYLEMMPQDETRPGKRPVFALSPSPGDVDILIAAELAEAGRAVLRGFVTPDRTALIASSHRVLAISEKMIPGDGRTDGNKVLERTREAARRALLFDMEAIAKEAGTVISASLFGALAGSGELPFPRSEYEATIKSGGRGVGASLAAFAAAYQRADEDGLGSEPEQEPGRPERRGMAVRGPDRLRQEWDALCNRIQVFPEPVRVYAEPGLRKVVDFLDNAYGDAYLRHLERIIASDRADKDFTFSREAAKYLANAMVYDDIIRVADLKTRSSRTERVRQEVHLNKEQTLLVTEYFHPRMEEVVGLLPIRLGAAIEARPALMARLNRIVDRGRRIRTDGLVGFGMLWLIAGLRRWRRGLLRHKVESDHLEKWLDLAVQKRAEQYELGVEVLKTRRLIKGYSDTHSRGHSKFDMVLGCLPMLQGRDDAADWIRRLREAALADAEGVALKGAIGTVRSFCEPVPAFADTARQDGV